MKNKTWSMLFALVLVALLWGCSNASQETRREEGSGCRALS